MEQDVVMQVPPVERNLDRVRARTSERANQKIYQATLKRVWQYAYEPREVISARIRELDKEWDLERILETKAAGLALTGLVLSAAVDKRWLLLPAAVMSFLLQHSVKRTCLPVQLLRRVGVRTRKEIEAEYALKLLRGDFDAIPQIKETTHRAIEALRVARL
jgi:hypothetical protein